MILAISYRSVKIQNATPEHFPGGEFRFNVLNRNVFVYQKHNLLVCSTHTADFESKEKSTGAEAPVAIIWCNVSDYWDNNRMYADGQ